MDFIYDNLSTIVVGALVFGVLGFVLFRLIRKARRGEGGCPHCCSHCEARATPPAKPDGTSRPS
jgi:hypothetical protein